MLVGVRGLAAGSGLCEGSDIPGGVGDIRTEELIGNCLPMDMAQAEGGGGGHGPFEMTGLKPCAWRIRALVWPRERSSSGARASMRSRRTAATWPGAVSTTFCQPGPVRTALMKRPSPGDGSRRTQPFASRRLTTWLSRDTEPLAIAASWLIRSARPGASDRLDSTMYSKWLMPASFWSWASRSAGKRKSSPTNGRHAACSSSLSHSMVFILRRLVDASNYVDRVEASSIEFTGLRQEL